MKYICFSFTVFLAFFRNVQMNDSINSRIEFSTAINFQVGNFQSFRSLSKFDLLNKLGSSELVLKSSNLYDFQTFGEVIVQNDVRSIRE